MGSWHARGNVFEELLAGFDDSSVFVNSKRKAGLGEEILRTIGSARSSVMMINPIISDHRFVQEILAVRERGVRVKLITELRENRKTGIKYPTRGFEVEDEGHLNEHFEALRRLAIGRVHCRATRYYAHAKVIVIDDARAIFSSANGNSNSLGWGPQISIEAGITINDTSVVSKISAFTNQIWDQCPFRLQLLENDISLQESAVDKHNSFSLDSLISEKCRLVWSYPPQGRALRDSLIRMVRQAGEKITCVALSFYETDKVQDLHTALLEALSRRVQVTVIVRKEHFRPEQFPDESTKELLGNGLRLLGMTGLHANGMVVDHHYCAIFSGNFNPFSLESDADSAQMEVGICELGEGRILGPYGKWITALEDAADFEYR